MVKSIQNPFEVLEKRLLFIENLLLELKQNSSSNFAKERDVPIPNEFLNKKEAARIASLSVSTIDNLRREGELKPYYFGSSVRFKRAELLEYLESRRLKI